jgi:hypothetical protein
MTGLLTRYVSFAPDTKYQFNARILYEIIIHQFCYCGIGSEQRPPVIQDRYKTGLMALGTLVESRPASGGDNLGTAKLR